MRETLTNISNALQQGNTERAEIYAQELVCHLKSKGLLCSTSGSSMTSKSSSFTGLPSTKLHTYTDRGVHA